MSEQMRFEYEDGGAITRESLSRLPDEDLDRARYGDAEHNKLAREVWAARQYAIRKLGEAAEQYFEDFDPREDGIT